MALFSKHSHEVGEAALSGELWDLIPLHFELGVLSKKNTQNIRQNLMTIVSFRTSLSAASNNNKTKKPRTQM